MWEEKMKGKILPFGLLFKENAVDINDDVVEPIYDPEEGISYIYDPTGKRIAYAEWCQLYFGTKTGDNTKTILDPTDTDP